MYKSCTYTVKCVHIVYTASSVSSYAMRQVIAANNWNNKKKKKKTSNDILLGTQVHIHLHVYILL